MPRHRHFWLLMLIPGTILAQDAALKAPSADNLPHLTDQPFEAAPFAGWGELTYRIHFREAEAPGVPPIPVGTAIFKTEVVEGVALFDDKIDIDDGQRLIKIKLQTACRAEKTLPLIRSFGESHVEILGDNPETEYVGYSVTITGGRAHRIFDLNSVIRTSDFDWPADAVADTAIYRLVPQLPKTPGKAYRVDKWFYVADGHFRGQMIIRCEGPAKITLDGKAIDTTRYTLWRHRRHWGDLYIGPSGIPERMVIEGNQVLDRLRPDVF